MQMVVEILALLHSRKVHPSFPRISEENQVQAKLLKKRKKTKNRKVFINHHVVPNEYRE